jgi:hypothetical protein
MSDLTTEPTQHQIAQLVRMAADLPSEDIVHVMFLIQEQGPTTPGAAVIRRAIAEILSLRVTLRRMRNS